MPRSAVLVVSVAAVVAVAFAYHALSPDTSSSTPGSERGADGTTVTALHDMGQRLDRLEHEVFQPRLAASEPAARLVDLEQRLRALELRSVRSVASPVAAREVHSLEPARPANIRSLADADLLVKARTLASEHACSDAAPYWREVLERGPSDEVFVEAHIQLGYAHRVAKDRDREEASFREALRVAGANSERGQQVLYQLAWTANYRGDYASARDLMVSVANAPATSRTLTGHARLNVAYFSLQLNDGERAREALHSMLRDFGGSVIPIEAWFARQATERLKQLE